MTFSEWAALFGNLGQFAQGLLAVGAAVVAWRSGLLRRLTEFRHTKREESRARIAETLWARATQLHKLSALVIISQGEMRREKAQKQLDLFNEAYLGFVEETARAMLILPLQVCVVIDAYSDAVTPVLTALMEATVASQDTVVVKTPFRALTDLEPPFMRLKDVLQEIATFGEVNT